MTDFNENIAEKALTTAGNTVLLDEKQTAELLLEKDNILLISHARPDGDTVGSTVALCEALRLCGKNVRMYCADSIPKRLAFLLDKCEITAKAKENHTEENGSVTLNEIPFEVKYRVSVDVASIQLIGGDENDLPAINLKIDHHPAREPFAEYDITDSTAGACAQIVYRICKHLPIEINANIAGAIFAAIVSDTGSFKFSNATAETHRIAAELLEYGIDHAAICRDLFGTHSLGEMKATELAVHNLRFYRDGTVAATALSQNELESYGIAKDEASSVNSLPVTITGVELGITLKEDTVPGCFKMSVRSNEYMEANTICAAFGGGGHIRAAGGLIHADTIEAALEMVLNEVFAHYGERASDYGDAISGTAESGLSDEKRL